MMVGIASRQVRSSLAMEIIPPTGRVVLAMRLPGLS
jgi:hypothetical protein